MRLDFALQYLCYSGYDKNMFIYSPILTWPTHMSNEVSVGRSPKIYKNCIINVVILVGSDENNFQQHPFVTNNARKDITENWSS